MLASRLAHGLAQPAPTPVLPSDDAPFRIHHYPTQLIDIWQLTTNLPITLRPVLPQDCAGLDAMLRRCSQRARKQRFHIAINGLPPEALRRMTQLDYRQQMAFVACVEEPGPGQRAERVVADARYVVDTLDGQAGVAEFAIVVEDDWQRRGIGARLMALLARAAQREGLHCLRGAVMCDNEAMLGLMAHCEFSSRPDPHDRSMVQVQKRPHVQAAAAHTNTSTGTAGWLSRWQTRLFGAHRCE
jgi:acetyltransferase